MEDEVESNVVEAAGTAAATSDTPAMNVQQAMNKALAEIQDECEKIWARKNLSAEAKNEKIAELMKPENVKARMLEARKAFVDGL
jgi:aspartate aminotransferase-like enzyme